MLILLWVRENLWFKISLKTFFWRINLRILKQYEEVFHVLDNTLKLKTPESPFPLSSYHSQLKVINHQKTSYWKVQLQQNTTIKSILVPSSPIKSFKDPLPTPLHHHSCTRIKLFLIASKSQMIKCLTINLEYEEEEVIFD